MLFFTYAQWGVLHIALLTAGLCVLAFRAARAGRLCPLLLAAAYAAGIFCFAHRMHERYLLMAVFLTLAAAAARANRQLLAIGCMLGTAASRRASSPVNSPMKNRGNRNSSSHTAVV